MQTPIVNQSLDVNSVFKSTKNSTSTTNGEIAFQQFLNSEIAAKSPAPIEKSPLPSPLSKPHAVKQSANTNAQAQVNKPLASKSHSVDSSPKNTDAPAQADSIDSNEASQIEHLSESVKTEETEPSTQSDQVESAEEQVATAQAYGVQPWMAVESRLTGGDLKNEPTQDGITIGEGIVANGADIPDAEYVSETPVTAEIQASGTTNTAADSKVQNQAGDASEFKIATPDSLPSRDGGIKLEGKAASEVHVQADATPRNSIQDGAQFVATKSTDGSANTTSQTNDNAIINAATTSKDVRTVDVTFNKIESNELKVTENTTLAAPTNFNVTNASAQISNAKDILYTSNAIEAKVGTTAWDKAIGNKVVWMVGEAMQSAELTLNPPDLGPLQVVLSVSNDQASANFSAAQPEVREALESALPRLKQMLSDAGIQLGSFSVSTGDNQSQSQWQSANQNNNSGNRTIFANEFSQPESPLPVNVKVTTLADGKVDTFV